MQITQQEREILPVFLWLLTVGWMVLMTVILLQPETQPLINTGIPPAPPSLQREILFSSIHLIFFGFTAVLWAMALRQHLPLHEALMMAIVIVIAYGVLTEFLQGRIPGRSPQLWDMAANAAGVLLGVALLRYAIKKQILA